MEHVLQRGRTLVDRFAQSCSENRRPARSRVELTALAAVGDGVKRPGVRPVGVGPTSFQSWMSASTRDSRGGRPYPDRLVEQSFAGQLLPAFAQALVDELDVALGADP